MSGVACRNPQIAYAGLKKSLQQDWDFMQRVTPDTGMTLQVVEDVLQDIFLPVLFQGSTAQIPGIAITGLPVKQARIAFLNPTWTAGANCMASYVITGHLVAAFHGTAKFRSVNHSLLMGGGEGGDTTETCRGGRDFPGGGPGRRIKAGRTTAGMDSEDRGVAVGDPLNRRWEGVRGAGMEGLPLPALHY